MKEKSENIALLEEVIKENFFTCTREDFNINDDQDSKFKNIRNRLLKKLFKMKASGNVSIPPTIDVFIDNINITNEYTFNNWHVNEEGNIVQDQELRYNDDNTNVIINPKGIIYCSRTYQNIFPITKKNEDVEELMHLLKIKKICLDQIIKDIEHNLNNARACNEILKKINKDLEKYKLTYIVQKRTVIYDGMYSIEDTLSFNGLDKLSLNGFSDVNENTIFRKIVNYPPSEPISSDDVLNEIEEVLGEDYKIDHENINMQVSKDYLPGYYLVDDNKDVLLLFKLYQAGQNYDFTAAQVRNIMARKQKSHKNK